MTDAPEAQPSDEALRVELEVVQERLEQRFPEVDSDTVAEVVDQAAEVTAGAKIQTFRPLLVEHRAGDELRRLRRGA
jgi:hypothetical protein